LSKSGLTAEYFRRGFRLDRPQKPGDLLKVGDLAQLSIQELRDNTVRVQLEQQPGPQGALLAIDNPTGEIKAMIGGYSF